MPTPELVRAATYFRSMAKATAHTVAMATQDLVDARAAEREGDTTHPLTVAQALELKAGLQREQLLWTQLADEIDDYLAHEGVSTDEGHDLVDLFTPDADDETEEARA